MSPDNDTVPLQDKSSLSKALEKLRTANDFLQKRIAHLETLKADHERILVELELKRRRGLSLDTSNIRKVKTELRRRRIRELSIQKLDALSGHLECQIASIEDSKTMAVSLSALKSGAKVGRKQSELIEKMDVEKIMDDFAENNEIMISIQKAMDNTGNWIDTMDDEQALSELERLIEHEQVQKKFVTQDSERVLEGLPGVPVRDPDESETSEIVVDMLAL